MFCGTGFRPLSACGSYRRRGGCFGGFGQRGGAYCSRRPFRRGNVPIAASPFIDLKSAVQSVIALPYPPDIHWRLRGGNAPTRSDGFTVGAAWLHTTAPNFVRSKLLTGID